MSEPIRTKMCFEELLEKFEKAAQEWLAATPEARGLALTIDWAVGKDDFPPCVLVSKHATLNSTTDMMRQATRLMDHLTHIYMKQINDLKQQLASQAEKK